MKKGLFLEWVERHRSRIRLFTVPTVVLLMLAITLLVANTGGVKFGYSHAMYIPVLLAGFVFGYRGGVLAGLLAGLMLGPFMPLDMLTGEPQNYGNWLFRLCIFMLTGFLAGLASDSTKSYQGSLRWLLEHDSSTQLPNRCALLKRLEHLQPNPEDRSENYLLVALCCENEIELKSAFGSKVVEQTILQLAQRFKGLCQHAEVYHTDLSQVALLFRVKNSQTETLLAELLENAREPVFYNHLKIHIDTRMGYYLFDSPDALPEDYIHMAEAALIVAKQTSRDMVAYSASIKTATEENISLLGQLKHALKTGQLALHYQPKIKLENGKIYGVEALLRWEHPSRGMIPPGLFIPRAEQSTLIDLITEFVLEQAVKQLSIWQKSGINVTISVNISTRNLLKPGFTDFIVRLLNQYDLRGELLELEITEGSLMIDVNRAIDELNRLTRLNIVISIDDFGTGYSSLQYLHQLPISVLKIDQSFVRRLPDDQGAAYIIEAAVTLAHNLGLKAIAEGVENRDVYELLQRMNCDMVQGYMVSHPLPAPAFVAWYRLYAGYYHYATVG
jgi:EAL domain-containing protein (putative c-di-GMP-specific phosphodiesterase class I)/GGDEF domain-containing protein